MFICEDPRLLRSFSQEFNRGFEIAGFAAAARDHDAGGVANARRPAASSSEQFTLLDAHTIGLAAAESLRMIHLLGFRGWDDEISGCCRARHVRVLVHAFPQ